MSIAGEGVILRDGSTRTESTRGISGGEWTDMSLTDEPNMVFFDLKININHFINLYLNYKIYNWNWL